jgi:sugar phosphate isomerase/epimerase
VKIGIADYGFNEWDGALYDIEERLHAIKKMGFDGIERVEAVSPSDALQKAAIYRKTGMDFGTCRGPNVQANIQWTCGLGKDYVWLTPGDLSRSAVSFDVFIRRASRMVEVCARWGLKAGLHNHLKLAVETPEELEEFLKLVPGACLLLDTGHLGLAGGDPIAVIRRHAKRLCAVHFKDAEKRPDGTHTARPLGLGNLGLDHKAIANELVKAGYDGWIFMEPEDFSRNPAEEAGIGLDLLRSTDIFKHS